MTLEFALRNWALLGAGTVGGLALMALLTLAYRRSARSRLRRAGRQLKAERSRARQAAKAVANAERRLDRLRARAATVPPRRLDDAAGLLEDARMLGKIADDRVLIAENRVRTLIVEEFAPTRHAALRNRYFPGTDENR